MLQFHKPLMAAVLLALGSSPLLANTCDQLSPLKQALGDGYWDVESVIEIANTPNSSHTKSLSKATTERADALSVLELFNSRRFQTVTGVRVDCKGGGASLRQLEYESTLRLTDYGKKHSGAQTIRFLEKLGNERQVSGTDRRTRVERGSLTAEKSVIVELPAVSEWLIHENNEISTSQINRRRNELGTTYIQQIDTELQKVDAGVRLSQTLYVNGHRATWATWTLVR